MNVNNPGESPWQPGNRNSPPSYAQPGSVHQPPQFSPPPQQQKSSQRGSVVSFSIAVVLLILMCGGVGVAIYIGVQKAKDAIQYNISGLAASEKVRQFCQTYELQDYSSAYQMLSRAAQGRTSQTQFASHQTAVDASMGNVVTCTVDSHHPQPTISSDGKTATAWLQVTRGENKNLATGTLTLVYEDSVWKIDGADSSLKLL